MNIPDHFKDYRCADYFSEFTRGVWSESEQMWLIGSQDKLVERDGFLVVGTAGVDGITFGYRLQREGIWAHYPIEDEFRFIARSVSALVDGWLGGSIKV